MSRTKRLVQSNVTHLADHQTGEVTQSETTNVYRLPAEPPYVKLYLDDLSRLVGLNSGQTKLLFELARRIDFEGLISLTPGVRRRIRERLGYTDQTLRNRLRELHKTEVIRRVGQSEYEANPHYFARGDWKSICAKREEFELNIRYTRDGRRTVTTRGKDATAESHPQTPLDLDD